MIRHMLNGNTCDPDVGSSRITGRSDDEHPECSCGIELLTACNADEWCALCPGDDLWSIAPLPICHAQSAVKGINREHLPVRSKYLMVLHVNHLLHAVWKEQADIRQTMSENPERAPPFPHSTVRAVSRIEGYDSANITPYMAPRQQHGAGTKTSMSPKDVTITTTVDLDPEKTAHAIVQWVTAHLDHDRVLRLLSTPDNRSGRNEEQLYSITAGLAYMQWDYDNTLSPPPAKPPPVPQENSSGDPPPTPEERLSAWLATFEANLSALFTRAQQVPAQEVSSRRSIRIQTQHPVPSADTLHAMRSQTSAVQDAYGQLFIPFGALVPLGMPDCFVEYVTATPPRTPQDVTALEKSGTVYSPGTDPARAKRLAALGITEDMLKKSQSERLDRENRPPTYSFAPVGFIVNPGALHVVLRGHVLPVAPNEEEIASRFDLVLRTSRDGATPEDLLAVSPMESDLRTIIANRILEGSLTCHVSGETLRYHSAEPVLHATPQPEMAHAAHLLITWSQTGLPQQDPGALTVGEHLLAGYLDAAFRALPKETQRMPIHLVALALHKAATMAHLELTPELLGGPPPEITRSHIQLWKQFFQPVRMRLDATYRLPALPKTGPDAEEHSL